MDWGMLWKGGPVSAWPYMQSKSSTVSQITQVEDREACRMPTPGELTSPYASEGSFAVGAQYGLIVVQARVHRLSINLTSRRITPKG
jgi:hypothetical protein